MMAKANENTSAPPARRKRLDWRRLTHSTEGSHDCHDAPERKTMKRGSGGILQKLKSIPSHRPSFSKHRGKQHTNVRCSLWGQSSQDLTLTTDHPVEPAAPCDALTESSDQDEQPTKTTKMIEEPPSSPPCAHHKQSHINVQRRRSSRSLYSLRSLGSSAAIRRTSGRRRDSGHSSSSRRSPFQHHKSSGCIDTKSNNPGAANSVLDTSETIRLRYMNEYFESCLFEWNDELNADPNRPSLLAFDGSDGDFCSCCDSLDDEIKYIEKNFGGGQCGPPMDSISIRLGENRRGALGSSMVSTITLDDMEE